MGHVIDKASSAQPAAQMHSGTIEASSSHEKTDAPGLPPLNLLLDDLEDAGKIDDPSAVLDAFVQWSASNGKPLYPHQEDAAAAIFSDEHVIAATPTGSGKSLIAVAALLHALSRGHRCFYTAPIKALVSEKFFDLVQLFGADNVGMVTGDASLNSQAPIICATAEILANEALRDGPETDCATVVMDEFHFYAERDRGWAWQVPLLEMPHTQMVLMSATLGDVSFFIDYLEKHTGRKVSLVDNARRPVPLEFSYTLDDLPTLVARLLDSERYPMYIVHFSQAAAVKTAQNLATTSIVPRDIRQQVADAIRHVSFGPGFGKVLSRLLKAGIGVHHAGMLPRYRRIVEQLTARGLLSVVCGTDTLGVGINVPITCVVFTALAKYDGQRQRHLSAREFHQIAGRAGRAGFDTVGYVEVQAPEHDIENHKLANKLTYGGRKGDMSDGLGNRGAKAAAAKKNASKKRGREGDISWSQATFDRLSAAQPEPLRSRFRMTHAMALHVLSGRRDAGQHLVWLAENNHDAPRDSNPHLRTLGQIVDSLRQAEVTEHLSSRQADERGDGLGRLRLIADLSEDFALNQELSPFALAAFDLLDPASPDYALDIVSVVESVMEDPRPVLYAQQRHARDEAYAALRAQGSDYHARQEELADITWPRPLADLLQASFATYQKSNPWALGSDISPKSIVRDMIERAMTFSQFIAYYGLERSEGVVLRYLSDVFRALRQIVAEELLSQELIEIIEWLGQMIAAIDQSLLNEWQQMADGTWQGSFAEDVLADVGADAANRRELAFGANPDGTVSFSANAHALASSVRNEMWRIVEAMAQDNPDQLADMDFAGWDGDLWDEALEAYYDDYEDMGIGQSARSTALTDIIQAPSAADVDDWLDLLDSDACIVRAHMDDLRRRIDRLVEVKRLWLAKQTLEDPDGNLDWQLWAAVDLEESNRRQRAAIVPLGIMVL